MASHKQRQAKIGVEISLWPHIQGKMQDAVSRFKQLKCNMQPKNQVSTPKVPDRLMFVKDKKLNRFLIVSTKD